MGCILFVNIFQHWCIIHPGTLLEHAILESLAFAVAPASLFSLAFFQILETVHSATRTLLVEVGGAPVVIPQRETWTVKNSLGLKVVLNWKAYNYVRWGAVAVQWLVLTARRLYLGFCMQFACSPHVCIAIPAYPQSKDMQLGIGEPGWQYKSKLSRHLLKATSSFV